VNVMQYDPKEMCQQITVTSGTTITNPQARELFGDFEDEDW